MVYLHFPSNLTEEEQALQSKYQKLKKKKKALQLLKAPKPEPEKQVILKRPTEGKDAKEVAKKLILSGAITTIKVDNKEKQGFKRSKNWERKLSCSEKTSSAVSGYQPFSQAHPTNEPTDQPEETPTADKDGPTTPTSATRPQVKNLYESFVSARPDPLAPRENDTEHENPRFEREQRERPKQGNTVYVHGYNITEDILRNAFSTFGNILNISMEVDRNCGFITFEKMEFAEKSINEMNGSMVSGIQLKVSLARRQPIIETLTENAHGSSWGAIAASQSQKGAHVDKRNMVTYDDDIF